MNKQAGALEEADGSRSMRRILALLFCACALFCFVVAAVEDSQWGFWGGVACALAVSLLLGLTTVEEISRIARYLPGERSERLPAESPFIPGSLPGEENHE